MSLRDNHGTVSIYWYGVLQYLLHFADIGNEAELGDHTVKKKKKKRKE